MSNIGNYDIDNMSKEELEELKKDLKGKTLSINDAKKRERERAFAEIMSSEAIQQREAIQRRREERYEEMIAAAEEVESPMSRKH